MSGAKFVINLLYIEIQKMPQKIIYIPVTCQNFF